MIKESNQNLSETTDIRTGIYQLVLYNDDIHTFDFVIDSLVAVCRHSYDQATQCALITHYKGKCSIKEGTLQMLFPLKNALGKKNLTVEIENT